MKDTIPSYHLCFPQHTPTTVVYSWKIPSTNATHLLCLPLIHCDSLLEDTTSLHHPFLSPSGTVAHSWKIPSPTESHLLVYPHKMWFIHGRHHPSTSYILPISSAQTLQSILRLYHSFIASLFVPPHPLWLIPERYYPLYYLSFLSSYALWLILGRYFVLTSHNLPVSLPPPSLQKNTILSFLEDTFP